MGKLPVLLVLVGACALWSCGGDDEGDGSDDGGAAGEAGSGGAGGNNGGRGGAGGTGTGASAGAGSGGLGAAGTGGEGEGGTPEPGCETRSAGDTFGELDGQAIDEFWSVDSLGRAEGDPWFWIDEIDGRGYDFFRSSGEGNPTQLGSEVHDLSIGILWAPSSSDVAGEVICFGAGTAERTQTGVVEFKTEHAELLGACPGEPVDGEVTLCNGPCTNPVENELEGEPLSTPGMTLSGSGEAPDTIIQGRADNLFVISYVSGELASEATGDVEQALLVTYEGDVYCAGSDSTYEWAGVNGTQLTLRNLSKLGTCTPDGGSGSLLACR